MRKLAIFAAIALLLCFTACDDFFAGSWGTQRVYDLSKINIDTGNLETFKDMAVGNPDLANKVGKKVTDKIKNAGSNSEKAKYMDAAVDFAWSGSELGTGVISAIGSLLSDGIENIGTEAVTDLMGTIIGIVSSDNFATAAENLTESGMASLANPAATTPKFNDGYLENADPEGVDKAIMLLAVEIVSNFEIDIDNLENEFFDKIGNFTADGNGIISIVGSVDDDVRVLVAYLNLFGQNPDLRDKSFIGSSIYDVIISSI